MATSQQPFGAVSIYGIGMALLDQAQEHAATLKTLAYAGFGFGSASGAWTWLDANAGAIGAVCSIAGLSFGIVMGILNYQANRHQ